MKLFNKLIETLYFNQKDNLALYDRLTGLYNYNWLKVKGFNLFGNKDCYVTVIDVNNFKNINDIKGHIYGNHVLTDIANQLKRANQVDSKAVVIRFGGDEFVIISYVNIKEYMDRDRQDNLISYGCYHKLVNTSLLDAIEGADQLMYEHKKKLKEESNE